MSFRDKAAIVTGGTRGIGKAIVLELAKNGCHVAFNYARSAELANQLMKDVENLGVSGLSFQADVSNLEDVKNMVKSVKDKLGRIDYLVNNAGIARDNLLARMSEADWDSVINTNLKGAFNFSKAVVREMMRQRNGTILNITSISGIVGLPGQANYSASKAGMIGLTKAMAKELGDRNVNVNALALGFVETDMMDALDEEYKQKMKEMIPIKRFGSAEEVARIALFLLSDDAKYITGQVVQADGGMAM